MALILKRCRHRACHVLLLRPILEIFDPPKLSFRAKKSVHALDKAGADIF
jgi:hypothetical protein